MTQTNRGRPKGSCNRLTNAAKEAIQMAFDKLGGVDRLVEWAKEDKANEFAFYTKIYPKLLPRPAPEPAPQPDPPVVVRETLVWRRPDEVDEAEERAKAELAQRSVSGEVLRDGSGQAPGSSFSPAPAGPESSEPTGAAAASGTEAAEPRAGETGPSDGGQGP